MQMLIPATDPKHRTIILAKTGNNSVLCTHFNLSRKLPFMGNGHRIYNTREQLGCLPFPCFSVSRPTRMEQPRLATPCISTIEKPIRTSWQRKTPTDLFVFQLFRISYILRAYPGKCVNACCLMLSCQPSLISFTVSTNVFLMAKWQI